MKAAALLTAFIVAKIAVVPVHLWATTPWAPFALLWQDVCVALGSGVIERLFARTRFERLLTLGYWLLIGYVAINVPVGRALATPLTWPMLRAAGGPLADSFLLYLTGTNVVLMWLVIVIGALPYGLRHGVGPWIGSQRASGVLAVGALAIAILGPVANARSYVFGFDRNVLTALASSALPPVAAERREADWRRSPLATAGPAESLARMSGLAAGANIIVVSLESTAAQYLGLYGAAPDPMPNLTALARQAVVFDAAYAIYPESIKGLFSTLCSAPLAFTTPVEVYGRTPCRSFASVLKDRGYRTGLFHSGRFDYLGMADIVNERGFDTLEDAGAIGGVRESSFGVDDRATVGRILEWIDSGSRREPFLVTYLPISGHHPYEAPRGSFGDATEIDRYRNALANGDATLGALIEGLRARGLEQDTVWILYGDHGEAFGQHIANFGHTFYVYDENVRVPFVIAAPGRLEGTTHIGRVVSLVDTAPTILDLAGLAPPAEYRGRSMLRPDTAMALFFTDYSLYFAGVRDGPWKYVLAVGSERSELFDLRQDPAERSNLAASQPERTTEYREHVKRWIAAEKAQVRTHRASP
jgi:arylsulfatase A-like enzyme